jgi:hypothetical protein
MLSGTNFSARGSYERPINALAVAFASRGALTGPTLARYTVEYVGTLHGRAIEGHLIRVREGEAASLLTTSLVSQKVLMILAEDNSELKVVEEWQTANPKFYKIGPADTTVM